MVLDGPVPEQVVKRWRDVGESGDAVQIVYEFTAHGAGQVDNQWDAHDLRIDEIRMHAPAEFAGRIPMIRGENDDALVVQAVRFQIGEQAAQTVISLLDLQGDPPIESRALPSRVAPRWVVVTGKHVNVLWLRIKEKGTASGGAGVQGRGELCDCRA